MGELKIKMKLHDMQASADTRGKRIQKVGVRGVKIPIRIRAKNNNIISTIGKFSVYTSLEEQIKGAHMSRYNEILYDTFKEKKVSLEILKDILIKLQNRLQSKDSYVKCTFEYFIEKEAPVSKKRGFLNYKCILEGKAVNGIEKYFLTVKVPYTSLCPCSKVISSYGAHNQRSYADVTVEIENDINLDDFITEIEQIGSSQLYSILKREDEKYVTEHAYEHPKFVEDMSRDIALYLDKRLDEDVFDYVVVINHEESIHVHNAVAVINAGRSLS